MEVNIKKDDNDRWGYVEQYSVYRTLETGNIKVVLSVSPEGKLSEPFVYRGGVFIPARQIDEEMGIEKYIRAKKPFYSLISDGFIVSIKAGWNFMTEEFLEDKSDFVIYHVSGKRIEENSGVLKLTRVLEIPDSLKDLMWEKCKEIAESDGDRVQLLRSRFREVGECIGEISY